VFERAFSAPVIAVSLPFGMAIELSGIELSGIEWSGEDARAIELSGIELRGAEAALAAELVEPARLASGTADSGTLSTPATVGELTERAALTAGLPVTDKVKVQLPVSPILSESVPDTV
jgi:hypothetical protein